MQPQFVAAPPNPPGAMMEAVQGAPPVVNPPPGAVYRPELNLAQNPFYYHVNGILYEAHMQKLYRSSHGMG